MSRKTQAITRKEEAKPARVPKLRFPAFRGAEKWNQETMSGIATVVMGSSPKSECYNESNSGLPLLQGNADIKNRLSAPRIFTSEITKECQIGDILMSVRAPVGTVAKAVHHACIGRGIAAIHAKQPNSQEFLYQWLLSYEPRWVSISQGGTFDAINSDDLRQVGLSKPSPAEQQKIADCLSSVDELMAAQARKVETLEIHKKGLMQQLFPREGETQPRLRFPEFQDAGEWEEKSFGRVLKIASGKGFKASEYSKTGIRLLQIENVGYGVTKWTENTIYLPETYSDEYPELVLRGGDIVLALNRPVTNNELKIAKIQKNEPIAILYQRVGRLEILDDSLQIDFAFHVCRQFIKDFVVNKSIGSDQPFISLKDLYSQKLRLPAPSEQQCIGDCLTSLDDLITAETQKLDALKTHKEGLMQQLFPSPE
jgi:type I restriction enzyme S subunit